MNQNTFLYKKLSALLLHFLKLIRITYNTETKFCNFRNAIPFTILLADLEVKSTFSFEAKKQYLFVIASQAIPDKIIIVNLIINMKTRYDVQ